MGDKALSLVARVAREKLRLGGEEFVAVLPGTSLMAAEAIARLLGQGSAHRQRQQGQAS